MNSNFSIELATPADFAEMLALHALNHAKSVAPDARADGFLTLDIARSDLELLHQMRLIWAARDEQSGALAGYVLAAPWEFYTRWPMFRTQTDRFPLALNGAQLTVENSFQYGPICVAQEFRGRGLVADLLEAVKARYRAQFRFGATFINVANARSMAAHRKLGFVTVDRWQTNGNDYETLAFETAQNKNIKL